MTGDISSHGLFVRTTLPAQLNQLIQVRVEPPDGAPPIALVAAVVHREPLEASLEHERFPGVGLRLVFRGGDLEKWETMVEALAQHVEQDPRFTAFAAAHPANGAWHGPEGSSTSAPDADDQERQLALRAGTREQLIRFLHQNLVHGEMRMTIPFSVQNGQPVALNVGHPTSSEAFVLHGTVDRPEAPLEPTVIRFENVNNELLKAFQRFADTGHAGEEEASS